MSKNGLVQLCSYEVVENCNEAGNGDADAGAGFRFGRVHGPGIRAYPLDAEYPLQLPDLEPVPGLAAACLRAAGPKSFQRQAARNWRFAVLAGAWLLFFPNAPYIFTDLIHLTTRFAAHFWVDLMLILPCALTGMVLGFVSLYLMQGIVKRLAGVALSWVFVAGIAGLSGFGVWLGRFLRFNSWDVLSRPVELYRGIGSEALQPLGPSASIVFAALFALFLLMTYVMLYALTHLRHSQPPAPATRPPGAKTANPRVAVPLGAV